MKAKELMIGDLVYAIFDIEDENEDYITEQVPVMIIGIDENCSLGDGYSVSYIPIGDVPDECCDCFDPIPLTAEILEKNGFVNKTQFMQCGNFGKEFLITWQLKEEKVLGHCESFLKINNWSKEDRPSYSGKCLYVHELQHALRLC